MYKNWFSLRSTFLLKNDFLLKENMIPIIPYLNHQRRTQDRYLLRESEDRRTRIFGTLLCELGFSILQKTGYGRLKFHLFNPDVSSKMWNMLIKARETAEEWAGYYVSDYEDFIQAQITLLAQESLKVLWTRFTGSSIKAPHQLTLMLLVCSGPGAGYRYQQYQSQNYNPEIEQTTSQEVDDHNTQLLQHLVIRWHLPIHVILLQTYRSGIFSSDWLHHHPEFKKLVQQGVAEPAFINDLLTPKETTVPCRPPQSRKRFPSLQKPSSLFHKNSNGGY